MYTFALSHVTLMHLGSTEEITLLEFDEAEEGDTLADPKGCLMIFGGPVACKSRRR